MQIFSLKYRASILRGSQTKAMGNLPWVNEQRTAKIVQKEIFYTINDRSINEMRRT